MAEPCLNISVSNATGYDAYVFFRYDKRYNEGVVGPPVYSSRFMHESANLLRTFAASNFPAIGQTMKMEIYDHNTQASAHHVTVVQRTPANCNADFYFHANADVTGGTIVVVPRGSLEYIDGGTGVLRTRPIAHHVLQNITSYKTVAKVEQTVDSVAKVFSAHVSAAEGLSHTMDITASNTTGSQAFVLSNRALFDSASIDASNYLVNNKRSIFTGFDITPGFRYELTVNDTDPQFKLLAASADSKVAKTACGIHAARSAYHVAATSATSNYISTFEAISPTTLSWEFGDSKCADSSCGYGGANQPSHNTANYNGTTNGGRFNNSVAYPSVIDGGPFLVNTDPAFTAAIAPNSVTPSSAIQKSILQFFLDGAGGFYKLPGTLPPSISSRLPVYHKADGSSVQITKADIETLYPCDIPAPLGSMWNAVDYSCGMHENLARRGGATSNGGLSYSRDAGNPWWPSAPGCEPKTNADGGLLVRSLVSSVDDTVVCSISVTRPYPEFDTPSNDLNGLYVDFETAATKLKAAGTTGVVVVPAPDGTPPPRRIFRWYYWVILVIVLAIVFSAVILVYAKKRKGRGRTNNNNVVHRDNISTAVNHYNNKPTRAAY